MHLFEPPLQPVQLRRRDAAFSTTTRAGRVERDESHRRRVVDVVRRSLLEVLGRESVASGVPAGLQVRVKKLAEDERAPVAVRRHIDVRT